MKKILAISMALLLALAVFAGCSDNQATPSDSTSPSASQSADANADQSLQKIKDAGKFVLGFDEGFPPMGFKDTDGTHKGLDIDLATEFCKRLGVELVLQPISWDAKYTELSNGNIDCIWNGFTIDEKSESSVLFSEPYMANRQIIVVAKDSGINTLADLAGKTLVTQEDSGALRAIEARPDVKDSLGELITMPDYVVAFTELKSGQIDAIAVDEVMSSWYIKENDYDFVILDEDLGDEEYGVGFRKDDKALVDEFNKIFEEMKADGTTKTISEKWFGKDLILQ